MPMPGRADGSVIASDASGGADPAAGKTIAAPPGMGKQVAQLIVIPAVIVIGVILIGVLLGVVAGSARDVDSLLSQLRADSGFQKTEYGLQDSKYKKRMTDAFELAMLISEMEDEQQRTYVGDELAKILSENVHEDEVEVRSYLLMAIGQLKQPSGLDVLKANLDSPHARVKVKAAQGLMAWIGDGPGSEDRRVVARETIPKLRDMLLFSDGSTSGNVDADVRNFAAWALGTIADESDETTRNLLAQAMQDGVGSTQEAQWAAATALAKLNDDRGVRFVLALLLDREALSQIPLKQPGNPASGQPLDNDAQTRVMLLTLSHVPQMDDKRIWERVRELAAQDTNSAVKNAANRLLSTGDGAGTEEE